MSEYLHLVRKWVKPEDLNQHDSLFGGRLLQWVDEEAAILAVAQLGTTNVVTRFMSEVEFAGRAERGDLLELVFGIVRFGRTSLTLRCSVGNAVTGGEVLTLERIVFVSVGDDGTPVPHGRSGATSGTERLRGA